MKKAPDFTLKDTSNQDVKLSDYRGSSNIVLLFFPLAFSGVCTKEVCSTRDNLKIYDSLNAVVFGISVDSFFTLKAFKQSNNLNFTLLSDFNKKVSESYGVLNHDFFGMRGVANRSVFVINNSGYIIYEEVKENADEMPDFGAVQEVLANSI
jgi:peroxiredoxin